MSDQVRSRRGRLLVTLALLPVVAVVGVVLLQASELTVPSRCVATSCFKALRVVGNERGAALTYGWIAAGAMLLVGLGLASRLVRSRARTGRVSALERDRDALIRACVDVSDVVVSEALREQLVDALSDAGVKPVNVAAGERFDSSRHRAVGRVRTGDRDWHNLVAKTERAGYVDRGKRLRYPEVLVFNADRGSRT